MCTETTGFSRTSFSEGCIQSVSGSLTVYHSCTVKTDPKPDKSSSNLYKAYKTFPKWLRTSKTWIWLLNSAARPTYASTAWLTFYNCTKNVCFWFFRCFLAANELQGLIRFYIERARQLYTRHRKKSVTFSKLPSESMRVQLPCTSHSQWTDEEENPFEMPIVTRIAMKSCKQVAPVILFAIAAVQMH